MIPVTVITGYLGSGKTTILSHLLRDPAYGDTAVIINEFGEIGLDHELIESSDEELVTLTTGCLCCKMRGDLLETLDNLMNRRHEGTVPSFSRVVIETSGLADPAPILQSLMADPTAAANFALPRVVTVVDAVNGAATLDRETEAVRQVALADQLIMTKTDLEPESARQLRARLPSLNRTAGIAGACHGDVTPHLIFSSEESQAGARIARIAEAVETYAARPTAHQSAIETFTLIRDAPIAAVALTLFLQALADHCGVNLLRLKGLVCIAECPERPAVIHGVQHVFHPPTWLEDWPSEDHRTRLVFIGRELNAAWASRLLDVIELEVAEM